MADKRKLQGSHSVILGGPKSKFPLGIPDLTPTHWLDHCRRDRQMSQESGRRR